MRINRQKQEVRMFNIAKKKEGEREEIILRAQEKNAQGIKYLYNLCSNNYIGTV